MTPTFPTRAVSPPTDAGDETAGPVAAGDELDDGADG